MCLRWRVVGIICFFKVLYSYKELIGDENKFVERREICDEVLGKVIIGRVFFARFSKFIEVC